ncbi:MAG: hypothetical protein IR153_06320 [Flavobacterium sp.]|nr:hypothetical protein [Flavobacterium sp.]
MRIIKLIFLPIIFLSLISCEHENFSSSSSVNNSNIISFEQFKSATGLSDFKTRISIPQREMALSRNADGSYELIDFIIDTDFVKQTVVDEKTTYTFLVTPKIITTKNLYNLIVFYENGNWETSILELIPTDDNFEALKNQDTDNFEGSIRRIYSSRLPYNDCEAVFVETKHCNLKGPCKNGTCDRCEVCVSYHAYMVCGDVVTEQFDQYDNGSDGSHGGGGGINNPAGYIFGTYFGEDAKALYKAEAANEFWSELDIYEQQWASNNSEAYIQLIEFFVQNLGEKELVNQMFDSLEDGGEVDLEYKIIREQSFIDNPCLEGVYNKLGEAITFQNYIKAFDGDFSVAHLKLESSMSLPDSINAETSPPVDYLITITFNGNNLDRPELSVARTFVHELIHAEVFRKLLSVAGTSSITLTAAQLVELKDNYPGLYDYYMRYEWNIQPGEEITSAQHQMMAQHYRDVIINMLKEFDNNSQSDEVYEALAWQGLMNTTAWNNLDASQQAAIINTITTFETTNPHCD